MDKELELAAMLEGEILMLNDLLDMAFEANLRIDLDIEQYSQMGKPEPKTTVKIKVYKNLHTPKPQTGL